MKKTTSRFPIPVLAAGLAALAIHSASAADPVAYEGYNGTPTGITGLTGTVTSPGLTYGSLSTTGTTSYLFGGNSNGGVLTSAVNDANAFNGTYSTTGTVWMSWLFTTNDGTTGGQYYQRLVTYNSLVAANGGERYNLGLMNAGGNGWAIRGDFFGGGNANSNGYPSQSDIPLNTTFLLAAAYNFGTSGASTDGGITLYVNPTGLGSGAAPTGADFTVNVTGKSDDLLAFDRLQWTGDFNRGNRFDELRVGSTWADVTPVPEPSTVAMLALSGVAMTVMARRRRKS